MEDNRTDVISSGSYSQLRIRDVSLMEDTGVYSCVAENPLSAEHAVTITIVESVCKWGCPHHHSGVCL